MQQPSISQVRQRVVDMNRAGYRFEQIEAMIESSEGLDEEQRSAVWLYAWSFAERGHQRYVARQAMQQVEAIAHRPHSVGYAD